MNSTRNGKATASDDVSIVPADERHAHAYVQIAPASFQNTSADKLRVKYTSNPKAIETNELIARADERLASAYALIARADEQLTRVTEQLLKLERDAGRYHSGVLGRRPVRGGSALRGLVALMLAACILAAAFASQSSYGVAARQIIARWAPQLVSTSSLTSNEPGLAAQPTPSAPELVAAEPVGPTPSGQTAPQELGPTVAPPSPELEQKLHTITNDLANAEHEIEQLKMSQQQMARDNAKGDEQLKATREQMANFIASVQNLQPKTTAPPLRPTATSTPKPGATRPSPKPRVQP